MLALAASTALGLALLSAPALSGFDVASAAFKPDAQVSVEPEGYGRIALDFARSEEPPNYTTENFNGIFVINFAEPVDLDTNTMLRRLSRYVSVIRFSDDRRSVRFGLSRGVEVNMTPAAERLYIDFLPPSWNADLPLLPQDVIIDLANRAEAALRQQRLSKSGNQNELIDPKLSISVGNHPAFTRIEMRWNIEFRSNIEKSDNSISFDFDLADTPDLGPINANPPQLVRSMSSSLGEDTTRLIIDLEPDVEVRTYREGNRMIVDLTNQELRTQNPDEYAIGLPSSKPVAEFGLDTEQQQAELDQPLTVAPLPVQPETPPVVQTSQGEVDLAQAPQQALPPRPEPFQELEAPTPGVEEAKDGIVAVAASRLGSTTEMTFPFNSDVQATIFQRGNALWMVFDTNAEFDLRAVESVYGESLVSKQIIDLEGSATALRFVLSEPGILGSAKRGDHWIISFGGDLSTRSRPVAFERGADSRGRLIMRAQFNEPGRVHRMIDPGVGDELVVVTAAPPVRGVVRSQAFVEFEALSSTQGLAFVPYVDDLEVKIDPLNVFIGRSGLGLRLSRESVGPPTIGSSTSSIGRKPGSFSSEVTGSVANFRDELLNRENSLSSAQEDDREQSSLDLIRFLLANGWAHEALGHVRRHIAEFTLAESDPDWVLLAGAAQLQTRRLDEARQTLESSLVSDLPESALLRTILAAKENEWREAKSLAPLGRQALSSYPPSVQTEFNFAAAEAALETGDHAAAAEALSLISSEAKTESDRANYFILRSKLADAAGQRGDAVKALEFAIATGYRPAVARAEFELARMDLRDNTASAEELTSRFEQLAASWRGDDLELNIRRNLGRLYVQQNNHRGAFQTLESAVSLDSDAPITRAMHTEMQDVFANIFVGQDEQSLPPLKAVGLFYDYRNLLPVGRHGDELVRKLANRLVRLDLLEKAAEILVHQVDNRLNGAAKAQIAADAAAIHIMNDEPNSALNLLRRTQQARLPKQISRQRRLLEAVALGEIGNGSTAIELLAGLEGPDVDQLRGDIYWTADNFASAAEAYTRSLGGRWSFTTPLSELERMQVMRAAVAYSVSGDEIGLEELRRKYAGLMASSPDATAFDVISGPIGGNSAEFDAVAQAIRGIQAIDSFMDDYTKRYMETPIIEDEALPEAPPTQQASAEETDNVAEAESEQDAG
jgi:outer membrane PBP1 activator LpoA protein